MLEERSKRPPIAGIVACALALAVHWIDWYVFLPYAFAIGLIVVLALALAGRDPQGSRGGVGDVLGGLALGPFVVPLAGILVLWALPNIPRDMPWPESDRYSSFCGVALPAQVWSLLHDDWCGWVPVSVACVALSARRMARDRTAAWPRLLGTLAFLGCAAPALAITGVELSAEWRQGVGAAAPVAWPLLCAMLWTAGSWIAGRRAPGARGLRVWVAASTTFAVIAATGQSSVDTEFRCRQDHISGAWRLLPWGALGPVYLVLAVLALLSVDPPARDVSANG